VLDAALAVVDEVGVDALTIRAVAQRVGAPAMSLYTHFANKEELLNLMYAEIAFRIYADGEHQTWQDGLRALCFQVRDGLLAHPKWIALLTRPAIPLAVPLRERILNLMDTAGIPADAAISTVTRAALWALGLTMVELSFQKPNGASSLTDRLEGLRSWSATGPTQEAVTRSAFAKMRPLDLKNTFSDLVHVFVTGHETQFQLAAIVQDSESTGP
jgi:TetR/AcrR family tetracycline transcriptional repressor